MQQPGWLDKYKQTSLCFAHELLNLVDEARSDLLLITCPVLLIALRHDQVVSAKNARRILAVLRSSDTELFWVERSGHMITLDYDKELVFQRAVDFIKRRTLS